MRKSRRIRPSFSRMCRLGQWPRAGISGPRLFPRRNEARNALAQRPFSVIKTRPETPRPALPRSTCPATSRGPLSCTPWKHDSVAFSGSVPGCEEGHGERGRGDHRRAHGGVVICGSFGDSAAVLRSGSASGVTALPACTLQRVILEPLRSSVPHGAAVLLTGANSVLSVPTFAL